MLRCGLDLVLSPSYSGPLFPTNVPIPVPALSDFVMSTSDYPAPSLECNNPGRDETTRKVLDQYYWPGAHQWIEQYMKGCVIFQQNKNLTHKMRAPLYKIPILVDAPPFTQVAMDLITGLLRSQGYDSILTIIDHGCSQGALFLPC
jgi:hypothetical protein